MAGSHEVASSTLAVSTRIRALSDSGSTSALHAESVGSIPTGSTTYGLLVHLGRTLHSQ